MPELVQMESATDVSAATSFLKPAFAKITGNLELLLGKPVSITSADPATVGRDEILARAPSPGMALGLQLAGEVEAELRCVVSQQLVLALICSVQLKSDEMFLERLAAATPLSATEQSSATEIALFIVAALGDMATEATGGRVVLSPMDPQFVDVGGQPPLGSLDSYVVVDSALTIAPAPAAPLMLIIPPTLIAAWAMPAPVFGAKDGKPAPATSTAAHAPGIWVAGREPFLSSAAAAVGQQVSHAAFSTMAALLVALERDPVPAVVVIEVPDGSGFELEVVAALRRHPSLHGSSLVVALETPTRRMVLKCAALGIADVIPAGLDQAMLGERLVGRARGASGARGTRLSGRRR